MKKEKTTVSKLEMLDTLMENIPDSIYFKDLKSRFIRISKALVERLKINNSDEALGKTDYDFFTKEHAAKAFSDEQNIIKKNVPIIKIEEKETYEGREDKWVSTIKMPFYDKKGKIIGTFGISRDITERKKVEKEIKSLAKFPEENPNLVGRIDYHGKIIYRNRVCKRALNDNGRISMKLQDAVKKIAAKKTFNQEDVEIEIGNRIFLFNLIPIKEESYINFYGRDITELKKAQENIIASEVKYRELFDSAPIGIAVIDNEGTINSVNEAMISMGGVPKEEILGKNFTEVGIIELKDIPFYKEIFTKILQGKVTKPFSASWHNRQGEKITGEVSATLLKQDGKIIGSQLRVRDITENIIAQEALHKSEEKYRTLVEKANEAITILQDGIFVFANRKTYELIGKQEGDLEGKTFVDFVWPEDREMVVTNHRRRMAGEALPNSFDFRVIGADSSPVWLSVSVAEIQYKGKPATLNLATDITERKKAEKLLIESEEKYRTLFDTSKEGVCIVEAETLKFKYTNPAICKMLGYTEKELTAMDIMAICQTSLALNHHVTSIEPATQNYI